MPWLESFAANARLLHAAERRRLAGVASASVVNLNRGATGPKVSSRARSIEGVASAITVGAEGPNP